MNNRKEAWIVALCMMAAMAISAIGRSGIPFDLHRGYAVLVRGQIGPVGKLRILVDTGATVTVVDSRLVRKLNLPTTPFRSPQLFGPDQQVEETELSHVQIGEFLKSSVAALVTDLSSMGQVDAIVGLDFLRDTRITIDYRSKTIQFGAQPALSSSCSFDIAAPVLAVPVRVQGKSLQLWLDTGAQQSILFEDRLRQKDLKLGLRDIGRIVHVSGTNLARRVELNRFELGSGSWKTVPALVVERSAVPQLEIDGLLSVASLRMTRIQLDFRAGVLSWE